MAAKYVRLPERLLSGNVTDLNTGWGIAGLDVKEVPSEEEDREVYNFITDGIRAGKLEEASKGEFDLVQSVHKEVADLAFKSMPADSGGPDRPSPHNEAAINRAASNGRKRLIAARLSNVYESGNDEDKNYERLKKDELIELARNRGLDESGTKDELVDRLEEDDETRP